VVFTLSRVGVPLPLCTPRCLSLLHRGQPGWMSLNGKKTWKGIKSTGQLRKQVRGVRELRLRGSAPHPSSRRSQSLGGERWFVQTFHFQDFLLDLSGSAAWRTHFFQASGWRQGENCVAFAEATDSNHPPAASWQNSCQMHVLKAPDSHRYPQIPIPKTLLTPAYGGPQTSILVYTSLYSFMHIYTFQHKFIRPTPGTSRWDRSFSEGKSLGGSEQCRYRCGMPELDTQLPAFLAADFSPCAWSRCQLRLGPCLRPDSGRKVSVPACKRGSERPS